MTKTVAMITIMLSMALLSSCDWFNQLRPENKLVQDFIQQVEEEGYLPPGGGMKCVKYPSESRKAGWAVFEVSDADGNKIYRAFDLSKFQIGMTITQFYDNSFYFPVGIDSVSTDPESGEQLYTGVALDANGHFQTFTFDGTDQSYKDLEKVGAIIENMQIVDMSEKLTTNFGLSTDRALKVALLISNWKKMSQSRQLTNEDARAFTNELLGVSISQLREAYATGDDRSMNELINTAARTNEITPEHMRDIIGLIK